ncbi:unnamed protein product, partial [Ectocarpus fasciculatus]
PVASNTLSTYEHIMHVLALHSQQPFSVCWSPAINTMRLQPLEGIGMEEEDARPTVALSLAGASGLPVLIIAGGKGSGGDAAASGEERDKELELMALPRTEEQRREDSHVKRTDTLGRPMLPWPEGRRLTPEDNETDGEDSAAADSDSESGDGNPTGGGGSSGQQGEDCGMGVGEETGGTGVVPASPMNQPQQQQQQPAATPAAAILPPSTPVPPVTPQGPTWQGAGGDNALGWRTLGGSADGQQAGRPTPQTPMSVSPSPLGAGVQQHLFSSPAGSTPGSGGGRKRARADGGADGKTGGASGGGGQQGARTLPGGPSPGSAGSRGGRRKRGAGAGPGGAGRGRAGSGGGGGGGATAAVGTSPPATGKGSAWPGGGAGGAASGGGAKEGLGERKRGSAVAGLAELGFEVGIVGVLGSGSKESRKGPTAAMTAVSTGTTAVARGRTSSGLDRDQLGRAAGGRGD